MLLGHNMTDMAADLETQRAARHGATPGVELCEARLPAECPYCPGWRDLADDAARGMAAAGAEVDALREQLATAHEAIGQAVALLNQGHTDAGLSVLYDALRQKA